jgi:dihydrofolate reductase
MRQLGFYITLTLDGFYADEDGGLADFDPSEEEHAYANGLMDRADDGVMGRVMYGVMTEYWDVIDIDDPARPVVERDFTRFWRETPKHVASRGRPELGPNATMIEGDVVDAVRRLKDGPGGEIMLGCGAELFAALSRAGLIDDYRFLVTSTALGRGKSLFGALDAPLRLRQTGTRTFDTGNVLREFVPA